MIRTQPLRYAIPGRTSVTTIIFRISRQLEINQCQRAVLVGHNAWFDLSFIQLAAVNVRKLGPCHCTRFTTFDTATLAAVTLGETVLARAVGLAGIRFDFSEAHSAAYDALKTAELFCYIVNSIGIKKS